MKTYTVLKRNRFFEVLSAISRENCSDDKVALLEEVDLSSAQRLRARYGETTGIKPSYTALIAKAVSQALLEHPYANRMPIHWPFWERIIQFHGVHVSVAVAWDRPGYEQAAFVATLRDSDRKDLAALTGELRALGRMAPEDNPRWRNFQWIIENLPARLAWLVLSLPRWFPSLWIEHRGGAALISSPAKYGGDALVGTWAWPLGFSFGKVKERPVAVKGVLTVRPTTVLTMSFNRHLMAGAPAARFFHRIVELLEQAEAEWAPPGVRTPLSSAADCVRV